MRLLLAAAVSILLLDSCCKLPIEPSALSDRFDQRKPLLLVDCITCNLENRSDVQVGAELGGPSGRYNVLATYGYNRHFWGVYARGGVSFQPFALPRATLLGDVSLAFGNPNFFIRPEIGFGAAHWFSPKETEGYNRKFHPAFGGSIAYNGEHNLVHPFVGLRMNIPQSPTTVGFRYYQLRYSDTQIAYHWGLSIAFRFGAFE